MTEELDIANACEFEGNLNPRWNVRQELWQVCTAAGNFGHCIYVWAGGIEDAMEAAIDFADEKGWCGWFTFLEESDFREAADDLKLPWQDHWPDWNDRDWEKVAEEAEADLSTIGHTTLKCQPKGSWGAYTDYNWGMNEVTDPKEIEEVARRSMQECHGHQFLVGDRVYYPGQVDEKWPEDSIAGGVYEVTDANDDVLEIQDDERYEVSDVPPIELEPYNPSNPKHRYRPRNEEQRMRDFFFPKRRGSFLELPSWRRK